MVIDRIVTIALRLPAGVTWLWAVKSVGTSHFTAQPLGVVAISVEREPLMWDLERFYCMLHSAFC